MAWAMQTAVMGEDAMAILARAQLYEEYILGPITRPQLGGRQSSLDLKNVSLNGPKGVSDLF